MILLLAVCVWLLVFVGVLDCVSLFVDGCCLSLFVVVVVRLIVAIVCVLCVVCRCLLLLFVFLLFAYT